MQLFVANGMQLEFSGVDQEVMQTEITYISDLDGPVNYVIGWYDYGSKYMNKLFVQSAAINMMGAFGQHPYNTLAIPGFTGGATFDALWWSTFLYCFTLGALPLAAAGNMAGFPSINGLFALPKYENLTIMRGFFNNDHGRISNTAILGEMYVDISEATKLIRN